MKTWKKEALVVGSILAIIAIFKWQAIELLGGAAVFFTFMHTQVSFRLSEAEQHRTEAQVECHRKAQYYFIARECLWFIYFASLGAWSALAGVIIFLLYPIWRAYHLSRKLKNAK